MTIKLHQDPVVVAALIAHETAILQHKLSTADAYTCTVTHYIKESEERIQQLIHPKPPLKWLSGTTIPPKEGRYRIQVRVKKELWVLNADWQASRWILPATHMEVAYMEVVFWRELGPEDIL